MAILQIVILLLGILYGAQARGYGPGTQSGIRTGSANGFRNTLPAATLDGLLRGGTELARLGPGGSRLGVNSVSVGGVGPSYGGPYSQPSPVSYQFSDGQGGFQFRTEERDAYGGVRGAYGYTDAQGLYRVVEYVADQYGYRAAVSTNEPGVGRESPADVVVNVGQTPQGVQERYTRRAASGAATGGVSGSGQRRNVGSFRGTASRDRPGGFVGTPSYPAATSSNTRYPGAFNAPGQAGALGLDLRRQGQVGQLAGDPRLAGRSFPGAFQGAVGSGSGLFSGIPLNTYGKSI